MSGPRRRSAAMARLAPLLMAVFQLGGNAQKLAGHSIDATPDIHRLVTDWWLAGTAIPTSGSLILNPGVRHRVGMAWAKYPLLTNNFEVTFELKVGKPATKAFTNAGIGFWIVQENATEAQDGIHASHIRKQEEIIADTWIPAMTGAGFDMLAYRSKYKGFGLLFTDGDEPSVSALANDGTQTLKQGSGVPAADAIKYNWPGEKFTVKVAVLPDAVKVVVGGQPEVTVKAEVGKGAYIGFTCHGGEKTADAGEASNVVELLGLEVVNKDTSIKGEEEITTLPPQAPVKVEKTDLLAEASSFKDFRAESDAIKELTNMVFKLVVQTQPARQQMARSIEMLTKRVEAMEHSFSELKQELDKKTGHKLGQEFEAIKKELTSLSSVASKETQERHTRLESLHQDITEMHKSAHSADNVENRLDTLKKFNTKVLDQLNTQHQTMFGVSVGAIAFIIIAGLSLYNKFRCWEKKHVL